MRTLFCETLLKHCSRPDFVFLTGDLGFNALEPLQKAAGERFLNAGVAEQNMVSVAAGLAQQGLRPWVYSIAPFLYARPYEQVRNDLCLHSLPVKLVGNGGGYGYGVMGGTHHALEDYGALLCLPSLKAYVPAFASDLPPMIERLLKADHPAYLRLGRDETPQGTVLPPYAPWRKVLSGNKATVLLIGPLAGPMLAAWKDREEAQRPEVWVLTEWDRAGADLPREFLESLSRTGTLAVAEEHVAHGGVGEWLASELLLRGKAPRKFRHFHAQGYPSGTYGSQDFHRTESGLTPQAVLKGLE